MDRWCEINGMSMGGVGKEGCEGCEVVEGLEGCEVVEGCAVGRKDVLWVGRK